MATEEKNRKPPCNADILEQDILLYISPGIRKIFKRIDFKKLGPIEEIRLRAGKPIMVQTLGGDCFIDEEGRITNRYGEHLFMVSQEDIIKTLELMSENSVYAYNSEIRNGFITLKGGHRVGIVGKAVLESNSVKNIKDISGLNIRISMEFLGCSDEIIKYIVKGENDVYNTLLISPPQCGKTTMLRDVTRLLSDGMDEPRFKGLKIGVVDERSELASCHKGVPQHNIGIRTDVLDGCPKSIGILMLLRSMSPQVIVTDEIGERGDFDAVMRVVNAGVKLITTIHGYSLKEIESKKEIMELMEMRVFERYIILSGAKGPGTVEEIIDGASKRTLLKRRGEEGAR